MASATAQEKTDAGARPIQALGMHARYLFETFNICFTRDCLGFWLTIREICVPKLPLHHREADQPAERFSDPPWPVLWETH